MNVERRGYVTQQTKCVNRNREERILLAKPYQISKKLVLESYKRVKRNRGAAGIDKVSLEEFEVNLKNNLYKIWNRMSSGTYFPPPVKCVEIPKANGGSRSLGIPTVADRIAQMTAKLYVEPRLDRLFHKDSYGYRPGKSAIQAVSVTRKRCWKYDWVVEFDIKGAFDNINHTLLMKAVRRHVTEKWILLYLERWLKVPFQREAGELTERAKGTPQGGVVSPLLMNLFMHYVFDRWISKEFPNCPFARYADDGVVHCQNRRQARQVLSAISERLRHCRLELHPEKSKIVYCKDSNRRSNDWPHIQFTFLGFTYRARSAVSKGGKRFTSFLPAISTQAKKRIFEQIKQWKIPKKTSISLIEIAELINPGIRGWWNYYGSFYKSELIPIDYHLDITLSRWVRRKYKKHAHRKRESAHWVKSVSIKLPKLFAHWELRNLTPG